MVKNRYKSLISIEGKRFPNKREPELENIIIKKLERLIARGQGIGVENLKDYNTLSDLLEVKLEVKQEEKEVEVED